MAQAATPDYTTPMRSPLNRMLRLTAGTALITASLLGLLALFVSGTSERSLLITVDTLGNLSLNRKAYEPERFHTLLRALQTPGAQCVLYLAPDDAAGDVGVLQPALRVAAATGFDQFGLVLSNSRGTSPARFSSGPPCPRLPESPVADCRLLPTGELVTADGRTERLTYSRRKALRRSIPANDRVEWAVAQETPLRVFAAALATWRALELPEVRVVEWFKTPRPAAPSLPAAAQPAAPAPAIP